MIRADLPVRATSARQRAKRDANAVRSPPSIEYRLSLSEPGSSTPSCHLALLSSKTTKTVACSPPAGVSVRSSFDILILEVGWWVELPILPPDHPPPHRIYAPLEAASGAHPSPLHRLRSLGVMLQDQHDVAGIDDVRQQLS